MVNEVVVFLASPGDCEQERRIVHEVADDVSQALGTKLDVRLRVFGWEQENPEAGRPQGRLNPHVDSCDIFVGLLKRRWGSPTGEYSSGFEEEFRRAFDRRADGDEPRIALWFGVIADDQLSDPGEQLRQVLSFQEDVRSNHVALHGTFTGANDLRSKLLVYFMSVLPEYASTGERPSQGTTAPTESSKEELQPDGPPDQARGQIAATAGALEALALGTETSDSWDPDRLLLIAMGLQSDTAMRLPVHVANRLFIRRADLKLAVAEVDLWARTLLEDAAREPSKRAVPGWRFLFPDGPTALAELADDIIGTGEAGAVGGFFDALRLLRLRPVALWHHDEAVAVWTKALDLATRSVAAYASETATPEDLSLLEQVSNASENVDITALLSVLRGTADDLAAFALSHSYPPAWLTDAVQSAVPELSPERQRELVRSGRVSTTVRAHAFRALLESGAADADTIEFVLGDQRLATDGADAILEQPVIPSAADEACRNTTDHRASKLRARIRARSESTADLTSELADASRQLEAWDALAWAADPSLKPMARDVFDTDGTSIIDSSRFDLLDKAKREKIRDFVSAQVRIGALRILLSGSPEPEDFGRLIAEVEKDHLLHEEVLELLLRVADSSHRDLLLEQLSTVYGTVRESLLDRILALGKSDAARSMLRDDDRSIRRSAAEHLIRNEDVEVDEVEALLFDRDEEVRIAAADELARRLPPDAINDLIDRYPTERSTYYYNVVAALDWSLFRLSPSADGDSSMLGTGT